MMRVDITKQIILENLYTVKWKIKRRSNIPKRVRNVWKCNCTK